MNVNRFDQRALQMLGLAALTWVCGCQDGTPDGYSAPMAASPADATPSVAGRCDVQDDRRAPVSIPNLALSECADLCLSFFTSIPNGATPGDCTFTRDGFSQVLGANEMVKTSPSPAAEMPVDGCLAAGILASTAARTLYVTTAGKDTNDGLSEATAWRTLVYASAHVQPGDLVYVRAGAYGNDPIKITKSGTAAAPIRFHGYRNTPGDNPTIPGFDHTSALDPSVMPLIQGTDRAVGVGVQFDGQSYLEIRNFQISQFDSLVRGINGKNLSFINLIATVAGNITDKKGSAVYFGKGITAPNGMNIRVADSVVVNAAAEGIVLTGDCHHITNNRVYSNDNSTLSAPTDYYITLRGNRHLIENNAVYRVGDLAHGGHGIGVKGCAKWNVIRRNAVYHISGEAMFARHRGVQYNRYEDNLVDGAAVYGSGTSGVGAALTTRDGASANLMQRNQVRNVTQGILFQDTIEDEGPDPCIDAEIVDTTVKLGGVANIYRNNTVEIGNDTSNAWAIDWNGNTQRGGRSFLNLLVGLTVTGTTSSKKNTYLFGVESVNYKNRLMDSTIGGLKTYAWTRPSGTPPVFDVMGNLLSGDRDWDIPLSLDITMSGNTFAVSNGFPAPTQN